MPAEIGVFGYLGPIVLLVSALLTAGYLLPITLKGFFPGQEEAQEPKHVQKKNRNTALAEPSVMMLLPIAVLAALAVLLGVFPNPLAGYLAELASAVL